MIKKDGRRPDILFVIGTLAVGGTELHVCDLVLRLAERGWKVLVYCLIQGGPLLAGMQQNGIEVLLPPVQRGKEVKSLPNRLFRLGVAAAHLMLVMLRCRPRIVHFFLPAAYLIGAPLAFITAIPIRVMSRRSLNIYQDKKPVWRAFERMLHRSMNAVLANSRAVARELRDLEGVSPERLGLIYNGIDVSRFDKKESDCDRTRLALGVSRSAIVLAIVANLIPYKGHADLLDALGILKAKLSTNWRLLIIGRDDGVLGALAAQAAALGIQDHILFLGPRVDIPELLLAADIGLLCSHEEGFSNAILEGMAAGLPMVVTNVGGNAEAVIDGETGLVVPPCNPTRLAQAIMVLVQDPVLRTRYGAMGRERVIRKFSNEQCIESYESLYQTLLKGGRLADLDRVRFS